VLNSLKKYALQAEEVDVSCFGGNDGSVVYTIGGGGSSIHIHVERWCYYQGPYKYACWHLYLNITDAIGCVRVTEKTITQPAEIVVVCNPIPLTTACSNDGHIFTMVTGGANPYDYLWNDGATTANRHNLSAATYTVTVTDKKGCIVIQTVVVTAPDSIQIGGHCTSGKLYKSFKW
jgi:hypothetical protein